MRDAIYVSKKSDVPEGDHYAILVFETIYIPGDERSRTHPGHGYPESNEPVVKYIAFVDKLMWEAEIRNLMSPRFGSPRDNFIAVFVKRASVKTTITTTVE